MDAGELVIKTVMNNDKFEKQYKQLENRYKNKQLDLEITTGDLQKEQDELERLNKEGEKLQVIYGKIKKEKQQWEARKLEVSTEIAPNTFRVHDYNAYNEAINQIQKLSSEESKVLDSIIKSNDETVKQEQVVEKITAKYEKQKNDLNLIKENVAELQYKSQQIEFNKVTSSIKSVGKEIGKSIKQITRMGLAIFGIRSAYMMVRSAISTISQDDAQLKADIDYIKKALAYSLEPIVRTIVNLAKELMIAIQRIAYVITGKNIFENANKNLAKASGSAKEIRKQLAGFDEMNVLSSSNGGGGTTKPSIDLSKMNELTNTGKGFLTILTGIAGAIASIKFAQLIKWLGLLGALPLWQLILGIGGVISGIAIMTFNLLEYISNPSWENFGQILQGIGIALAGIGVLFGAWPVAIAGAIVLVIGLIAQFWEKIEKFLVDLQTNIYKVGDNIVNWLHKNLGLFGDIIGAFVSTLTGLIAGVVDIITTAFGGVFNFIKEILDSIVLLFKGQFKDALKTAIKSIGNLFIDTLNTIISALNTVISPVSALIVEFGKITGKNWTMDNIKIPKIQRLAKGGIVNLPSRGVPIGNAITGESGREGVIPLQDAQALNEIADAIGRRITINANITNNMDGRTISRQLQIIQNERDFVMNR